MSWPLKLVKINGHSMMPLFNDGQLLLVNRWAYALKQPRVGDVVVFSLNKKLLCKRIAAIDGRNYFLRGDNPSDSLDSRAFGPVTFSDVVGKILG